MFNNHATTSVLIKRNFANGSIFPLVILTYHFTGYTEKVRLMQRVLFTLSQGLFFLILVSAPVLINGTNKAVSRVDVPSAVISAAEPSAPPEIRVANILYDSLQLNERGLNKQALIYGLKGYALLQKQGRLAKTAILSICDFSQSSKKKRLYIIDIENRRLLLNTYVAHGRNSGSEYARYFSNSPESLKSSLGFYVTRKTYRGGHGLSLRIEGLEKEFNDKADERNIVVHGSDYVGSDFLRSNKFLGRSLGCPAVPARETSLVINTIKDGSCLFIYHPTQRYLSRSKIINS